MRAEQPPTRPNILLLVAEDLSPRIGSFGDPVAQTPHLDRLAQEGVRYTRAFTTAGVCAPSRAALIMGQHAISFGAQHMRSSTRPAGAYAPVPPPSWRAFPEQMRAAGYYTYTDEKLDYQFSGTLYGTGPFTIWDDEGSGTSWRGRSSEQPFFGLVNFQITHESGVFPSLGWPHSFMHVVMNLLRTYQFGLAAGEGPVRAEQVALPPYYPDTPTVRADVARHYNNVHAMDRQVGELLTQLEADGLAESTIVIWTTDHGDGLPRAKRELFDSGLHVPMIVRWPESYRPDSARPGSTDSQLVSFVDLAPTILALADVAPSPELPGRSFLKVGAPERKYVYAARDRIDEVMDRQRAIRDERFKYIRSDFPKQAGGHPLPFRDNLEMMREMRELYDAGKLDPVQRLWFEAPGGERLYDSANDPHELKDLSQDPHYATTLERLRRDLDDWLAGIGEVGAEDESLMAERFWPGGEQPVTPNPHFERRTGGVAITGPPGASIGFRIDDGPWQLYTQSLHVAENARIEARAVRYGWQESETIRWD